MHAVSEVFLAPPKRKAAVAAEERMFSASSDDETQNDESSSDIRDDPSFPSVRLLRVAIYRQGMDETLRLVRRRSGVRYERAAVLSVATYVSTV